MKRIRIFFVLMVMAAVILSGCNRRTLPSVSEKGNIEGYDSSTFEYIFTEAIKMKFLGNSGEALKYLEKCVEINPQSDAAWYEMAGITLRLGDELRGKKFANKAVTLNEKNLWYLMLMANIYYEEGNKDSAVIFYEKATRLFPDRENVKMNLANIYSEKGDYGKADEIYRVFENKYGVTESISLSRIKILMSQKKWTEAGEILKRLIEENPDEILYNGLLAEIYREAGKRDEAISVYEKMISDNPNDPQTLLSLCDFLLVEKGFDDLFPILNKLVLSDSVSIDDKMPLFSRMIEDSSLVSEKSKELELALLVFETAESKKDFVFLLRPELYIKQNNIEGAINRLESIVDNRPENYFAWERLLILYAEKKSWDKLFLRGRECATKFNTSILAKILYANAAIEKEEYTVAAEELRKAMILAGNNSDFQVQVLVMKADMLYKKKEFLQSWDVYKEALRIKPEDSMVLNNYAYYLAEQNQDLKEAERMAKIVIEKEKNNATYLDTYAWVMFKRGRKKEALKVLESIVNLPGTPSPEWFEHLGYVYESLGKCEKAIDSWKSAIKFNPEKTILIKEIENCTKR